MGHSLNVDEVKRFLAGSVLFQSADDAGLELIANQVEHLRLKKGDPIVLENETSDHVYFIYAGSAEVVKHLPELNKLSRLAILQKGAQFSEFSVLNRARKGASVFALEDCEILRLSAKTFLEVLSQLPDVAQALVMHIARMTSHLHKNSKLKFQYVNADRISLHPKIPQIFPQGLWQRFGALPVQFADQSLYLAVRSPDKKDLFENLKSSQPNIRVKVSLINAEDFSAVAKQLQDAYRGDVPVPPRVEKTTIQIKTDETFWPRAFSLFKDMPDDWLSQILPHIQFASIPMGQSIYQHGQQSEKLNMCLSGDIEIVLPLNMGNAELEVGTVSPGEYFSEVSLLTGKEHSLTARAKTDVRLATISKDVFMELLKTPVFSLPLARDLAIQFQANSSKETYKLFDTTTPVNVAELAHLIPKSILAQYEILPLIVNDNEITIGITNPESATIYSVISRYLHNFRVKLEIISQENFKKWFAQIDVAAGGATTTVGRMASANAVRVSPVDALNKILVLGYEERASDIHFEPQLDCYVVRYRIDGVLKEHSEKFSLAVGAEMISRIKVLSKLDVTNRMTPQDGQLNADHEGVKVTARVSTLPTKQGENAVLRLIRSMSSVPPLSSIAADRRVVNIFRSVVASSQGVFLVTGPTGSGKSTTLYSLLEELNRVEVSIISLEDPVELQVAGTTQVEMNEKQGLTFAAALRSALRQDPNVIMIGEIRDEESAKIAFHAAATGHLVISTLHTNDSLAVVPRLLEMGISRQALGSTLLGASAQRLVRKICQKCIETRPIKQAEADMIKAELPHIEVPEVVSFGQGCPACGNSGYSGRLPIMEVWTKTRAIESALLEQKTLEPFLEEVYKSDFETLRQFALKMACAGLTTFDEVEKRFGGLTKKAA